MYTGGGGSHGTEFAPDHVHSSIGVWAQLPGGGAVEIFITVHLIMDYNSYVGPAIFRIAAMLGFRRLQSYMLPCLLCAPV